MTNFFKYIFHISLILLIIVSLFPGSFFGYLFYSDIGEEVNLVENPFGTTINHFIFYLYVSILGFFTYSRTQNYKRIVFILFVLSVLLECIHFIVPNRSFQIGDLLANILGVIVAYFVVKIYLFLLEYE